MERSKQNEGRPNRLINEKSPYLLEHAYNPVDWYPWGDEAFQRAKRENKPIFLSIGYSSCHWCHVFRRESLEDPGIAQFLNSNFVSIKVDREERPDIDEIYMKAVTSMTGSGGWPLNVFLTPTLEPIYGGTYFPPVSRGALPAFFTILKGVSDAWNSDRENILQSASQMKLALAEVYSTSDLAVADLGDSAFDACFNELASIFDEKYGGFGSAPKFPMPPYLFFLLRYYIRDRSKAPLLMVRRTLDQMACGGIYDHVGGGFHRYSTDREWLIPHFEKMLYDNALLSLVYTEGYLVTKDVHYKRITMDTLEWVLREMHSENGGFFSAQDADSSDGEGSYYAWNRDDVLKALTQAGDFDCKILERYAEIICRYFGISQAGNFEQGRSLLSTTEDVVRGISGDYSMSPSEINSIIGEAKISMYKFRIKRSKPATDDKILTSWNGLMISAMSKAYQAFEEEKFMFAARSSANFVLTNLCKKKNGECVGLIHRFREGDAKVDGLLDDYAYFVNGLIDLYESDFDPNFLKEAIELAEVMIEKFYDENKGGFYFTEKNASDLIARAKEGYDGVVPSGNSMAVLALFRLAEFAGNEKFRHKARETIRAFSSKIERQPSAFTFMLSALAFTVSGPKEVVFSGDKDSPQLRSLLRDYRSEFVPNGVTLIAEDEMAKLSPLAEGRIAGPADQAKVYVCSGNVCRLPAYSSEGLKQALEL